MMHTMSTQMFDGMFAAQCTWDASMGYNAVQNLKKFGGPRAIMVVLIGSGHVAYNLGVQRQAALWFDGKMADVPIPVADAKGCRARQASYTDYLWGPPEEDHSTRRSAFPGPRRASSLQVIDVPKDRSGQAGSRSGTLQAIDGTPLGIAKREPPAAEKADDAVFTVSRGCRDGDRRVPAPGPAGQVKRHVELAATPLPALPAACPSSPARHGGLSLTAAARGDRPVSVDSRIARSATASCSVQQSARRTAGRTPSAGQHHCRSGRWPRGRRRSRSSSKG
jgi:hypothetical protein